MTSSATPHGNDAPRSMEKERKANELGEDDVIDVKAEREESDTDEILDRVDRELDGLVPVKTRISEIADLLVVDCMRRKFGINSRSSTTSCPRRRRRRFATTWGGASASPASQVSKADLMRIEAEDILKSRVFADETPDGAPDGAAHKGSDDSDPDASNGEEAPEEQDIPGDDATSDGPRGTRRRERFRRGKGAELAEPGVVGALVGLEPVGRPARAVTAHCWSASAARPPPYRVHSTRRQLDTAEGSMPNPIGDLTAAFPPYLLRSEAALLWASRAWMRW